MLHEHAKSLFTNLLQTHHMPIDDHKSLVVNKFLQDPDTLNTLKIIDEQQVLLMAKWKLHDRTAEIMSQPLRISNASVGKLYQAEFDFAKLGWQDISTYQFEGLTEAGLQYDEQQKQIHGTPKQSGDFKFKFKFKLQGQKEEEGFNEKIIPLIINPDPKSLWKNLESNKADPYWKEDEVTIFDSLADRHILISSKRGRAHANVGSFREDDFGYTAYQNGWNMVVVSDGAGSATYSRKGSALVCKGILDFFGNAGSQTLLNDFDPIVSNYNTDPTESHQTQLNNYVYNTLGKAAFTVHKQLEEFAMQQSFALKDLSSTLIFTLFKKYNDHTVFLSFGVGDCPGAVIGKDLSEVYLLNKMDVGEFGGGTRFITMPEIFQNEKFYTRFSFKQVKEYAYLILMSDGIYDPKFVVENNLTKPQIWQEFLGDLAGNNKEGDRVDINSDNENIKAQLSKWMDFWSPGNHDDRTLAIVF